MRSQASSARPWLPVHLELSNIVGVTSFWCNIYRMSYLSLASFSKWISWSFRSSLRSSAENRAKWGTNLKRRCTSPGKSNSRNIRWLQFANRIYGVLWDSKLSSVNDVIQVDDSCWEYSASPIWYWIQQHKVASRPVSRFWHVPPGILEIPQCHTSRQTWTADGE